MKISFCSIAFRKRPETIFEIIPLIAGLGYDAIEIWGNHFNDSAISEIAAALDDHKLPVSMISPYLDFTAGAQETNKSLEIADNFIDKAVNLHSPNIRVFTGVVGSDEATGDQWEKAVQGLNKMCRLADGTNVNFALETHPKTLVDTVDSTLNLLEAVGSERLKVNLDIYHMWEAHGNPIHVLEKLRPFICHVHAKNADLPPSLNGRHPLLHDRQASQNIFGVTHLADGNMPYIEFLQALEASQFNGYVSVEWFGDNVVEAAKNELDFLRKFDVVDKISSTF